MVPALLSSCSSGTEEETKLAEKRNLLQTKDKDLSKKLSRVRCRVGAHGLAVSAGVGKRRRTPALPPDFIPELAP